MKIDNLLSKYWGAFSKNNSHFMEIFKSTATSLVFRILGLSVSYFFILFISRIYGPEMTGIFTLCMVLLNICAMVGQLGFNTSLIKFIAQFNSVKDYIRLKEVYKKTLIIVLPFSILLSVLVFLNVEVISEHIFNKPYLKKYFKLTSIAILPLVLLNINKQAIRGLKKIFKFNLLDRGIDFLIALIILIPVTFWSGKNYFFPIIAYIIGIGIVGLLSVVFWVKDSRSIHVGIYALNNSQFNNIRYSVLLSTSLCMFFISSMHFILRWTDTIMVGIFCSEKEVGIYNVVFRISSITLLGLEAVNSICAPKFAELYAQKYIEELRYYVNYSTRFIFWISTPMLLAFISMPSFILNIFGSSFKKGATAFVVLSIGQFVNASSGSVGLLMNMTGKEKVFQSIIFIATLINIVLNYILIPKFGINGAAIATTVSTLFWNLISVVYIRFNMGITTLYLPKLNKLLK